MAHGFSSCCVCAPGRLGFSSWGTQMLVVTNQPSCSVAYGILDHPPGIEPMSLALQGGYLTTEPLRKSPSQTFFYKFIFRRS